MLKQSHISISKQAQPLTIAMVVGEVSGDSLGAALMRDFAAQGIDAQFFGIGGSQMIAQGFQSVYPMESLSVMGLVEVLKHLKSLFAIRDGLLSHFKANLPDIFIGIDAPDFNLRVATQIKEQQLPIKTVQYVSPSVWAWRQKRVLNIKAACDLVLCLFPFEVEFYQQHNVPAMFVGHPLASILPLDSQPQPAIDALTLNPNQRYLALLPGSRAGEISRLLPVMIDTVIKLNRPDFDYQFLIPAVNKMRAKQIQEILSRQPESVQQKIILVENQGHTANIGRLAMQASDAVVLASGTATLEALLLHKPMVVIYKLHWLTYLIASWLVKIPYYSLPNILAKRALVSELIQHDATAEQIVQALQPLYSSEQGQIQQQALIQLHQDLIAHHSMISPAQAILQQFKL